MPHRRDRRASHLDRSARPGAILALDPFRSGSFGPGKSEGIDLARQAAGRIRTVGARRGIRPRDRGCQDPAPQISRKRRARPAAWRPFRVIAQSARHVTRARPCRCRSFDFARAKPPVSPGPTERRRIRHLSRADPACFRTLCDDRRRPRLLTCPVVEAARPALGAICQRNRPVGRRDRVDARQESIDRNLIASNMRVWDDLDNRTI